MTIYFAHSPAVQSREEMDFPYRDVEAWLGVGRKFGHEWAYVGFSETPNLMSTDTRDGYDAFRARVKWDNDVEYVSFTQKWGAKTIGFKNDEEAIAKMIVARTIILELDWYGEGLVHFQFTLDGSAVAIAEVRDSFKSGLGR